MTMRPMRCPRGCDETRVDVVGCPNPNCPDPAPANPIRRTLLDIYIRRIDNLGRFAVPKEVCIALGWCAGDELLAEVVDGKLIIAKKED